MLSEIKYNNTSEQDKLLSLDYAFDYAENRDWFVFPIRPGTKEPYSGFLWREQSTNDAIKVLELAEMYEGCDWALDCGKSGLMVLDEDNKKDKQGADSLLDLELLYGELPYNNLMIVETPSKGKHYYFQGLTACSEGKIGNGLDVRSDGGYVVIPGSSFGGRKYKLLNKTNPLDTVTPVPDWINDLAGKPLERKNKDQTPLTDLDQDSNIKRAINYLEHRAPPSIEGDGGDSNLYKVACRVRDLGVSEDTAVELIQDYWNDRCQPPWGYEELIKKLENAFNYARSPPASKTPQADFKSVENGCEKRGEAIKLIEPESRRIGDIGRIGEGEEGGKEERKKGLINVVMPVDQFKEVAFEPKTAYLHPWVTSQSISLVYGDAGTGKSWFALSVLKAIAMGEDLGPWEFRESAPVLYLDAEMTGHDVQERVRGLGIRDVPDFHIYSDAYATSKGAPKARLTSEKWRTAMKEVLLELGIKVWVIDNLASMTPDGDENTKEDWNDINQWLLDLRYNGVSTILMHHTNKGGTQRGTSARLDNIDFSIKLSHPVGYKRTDGARFDVNFEKARLNHEDLPKITDIQMQLIQKSDEGAYWEFSKPGGNKKYEVLRMISDGYKNVEISDELGCAKSNVTKLIAKLKEEGYITEDKKLTGAGFDYMTQIE